MLCREDSGMTHSVPFSHYTDKLNPALTNPSVPNLISLKSSLSKCGRATANLIKQNGKKFLWSNCFLNNLSFTQLHLCFTCARIPYTHLQCREIIVSTQPSATYPCCFQLCLTVVLGVAEIWESDKNLFLILAFSCYLALLHKCYFSL